nr:MAG TPA: hypothetical protein [Caudoviricetes sp.]
MSAIVKKFNCSYTVRKNSELYYSSTADFVKQSRKTIKSDTCQCYHIDVPLLSSTYENIIFL